MTAQLKTIRDAYRLLTKQLLEAQAGENHDPSRAPARFGGLGKDSGLDAVSEAISGHFELPAERNRQG